MKEYRGVRILAVIVLVLGLMMIGYWTAFIKQGMPLEGIPIASEIVTALTALVAALGLYRMKRWGYVISLVVAGMWIYAVVSGFQFVATEGLDFSSPIGARLDLLAFIIVLLFSLFLIGYLGKRRELFAQ